MLNILSAINKSPYDPLVEKATSEQNTSEDWQQILEINDRVSVEQNGPKECMRSIISRLHSDVPWVIMQTLTLLDSLVSNCGKRFHLEVCSRDFEEELLRLIRGGKTIHPKVSERARLLLKKWAQTKDIKKDPQLNLIPSLYEKLKSEGISFHSSEPSKRKSAVDETILKNPDYVANAEEEANLAKAIELSIQEAKKRGIKTDMIPVTSAVTNSSNSSSTTNNSNHQQTSSATSSSLYPSFNLSEINSSSNADSSSKSSNNSSKEPLKVRALYDFEAAEDNELTFKAGEIILVSDSSDANWWKGSNHRGEGLFPANFVSTDLDAEPESFFQKETKKVQFNEEVKVEEIKPEDVTIDEEKIDHLMSLLQEADPKSFEDPEELLRLEEQCLAMMPLIDQQMEEIDKRNAMLTSLNQQLSSALNLYHDLMKESLMMEQMASLQLQQYGEQQAHSVNYTQQYPMVNGSSYASNQVVTSQPSIEPNQSAGSYYQPAPSNYSQPQQGSAIPPTATNIPSNQPPTYGPYEATQHHQNMMMATSTHGGVMVSSTNNHMMIPSNVQSTTASTPAAAAVPNLL